MKKLLRTGLTILVATLPNLGAAYENDLPRYVSVGAGHFFMRDRSSDLSGPATPPGLGVNVQDGNTIGINYTQFLTSNISISALIGLPVKYSVLGTGNASALGEVATSKQAAPIVLLQYNFFNRNSLLRPFVGVGLNYTRFFDSQATESLNAALGGRTTVRIESSTGLAWEIGSRMKLNDSLTLTTRFIRVNTRSTVNIDTNGISRSTGIDFRPHIALASLDYSF